MPQRINDDDLNRLKQAIRDAAARGQFDPDPTIDNAQIMSIRANPAWFMVCDCVRAGDLPFFFFDTFRSGTLMCRRRDFLDALQALLVFNRLDPRSFKEGFGWEVQDRIVDWSNRFYGWLDQGVKI